MSAPVVPRSISVAEVYGDHGMTDDELHARLDRSLSPRAPGMLHDKMGALGLSGGHRLLDIGCRDARHACELVRRFGCRAVAIDPVPHNVGLARALVAEGGLDGAVEVTEGGIEAIPCADASFDFVWCRDMLNHVERLDVGLRECARVLAPGGAMLVFQTFATELLEPREAERLFAPLATVPENMSPDRLEATAARAGLRVAERDVVGSEWREHAEESGAGFASRQLLRIARLRRDRERLIREIGPIAYESELADCHWGVYQMLGKLCPRVYVLRRDA
jgi:SAM-dependent methyltransferase